MVQVPWFDKDDLKDQLGHLICPFYCSNSKDELLTTILTTLLEFLSTPATMPRLKVGPACHR
jgi:hypothetical protein